jgi:hypothetical protein
LGHENFKKSFYYNDQHEFALAFQIVNSIFERLEPEAHRHSINVLGKENQVKNHYEGQEYRYYDMAHPVETQRAVNDGRCWHIQHQDPEYQVDSEVEYEEEPICVEETFMPQVFGHSISLFLLSFFVALASEVGRHVFDLSAPEPLFIYGFN